MTPGDATSAIGKIVVYRDRSGETEIGVIRRVTDDYVFVQYGSETRAKATYARDIELAGIDRQTFLFDVQGTLVRNPNLREEEGEAFLRLLKKYCQQVIIWSYADVPRHFAVLADAVRRKDTDLVGMLARVDVVFDDDPETWEDYPLPNAEKVLAWDMRAWLTTWADSIL